MVSVKTFFAYLFYALLAAAFFLYLLFPDEAVKAYMDGRLSAIDPSLTIAAETMRPAIPPGIIMTGVDLNRDDARLAHFDDARVSPVLTTLLGDNKQARFQARLAKKQFSSDIAIYDTDHLKKDAAQNQAESDTEYGEHISHNNFLQNN